ncbi:YitT family protein [Actinoplanes xinjiangensis]|uniref:YitT family protein n=1 Tax=Actinoplanes xinjiangensis TaxID=512350 RepID=UPI003445B4BE
MIKAGSAPTVTQSVRHSLTEDAAGIVTGAFVASLGLFLLAAGGIATGGTAGLGLLIERTSGWPLSAVFALVNLPFVVLAITRRGWAFTVRTAVGVALVSVFSLLHPAMMSLPQLTPLYATIAGNLAAGIGILIIFRHNASLGGFGVVALTCQDRWGWRAGYVQMALDAVVILISAFVLPPAAALLSAVGAVVLNLVVAMNHRPGRYAGY